jgi:hypothetical protein
MTRSSHDRTPSQGEVTAYPESDRAFLKRGTLLGRGELAVSWTRCPGARTSRGQDVSSRWCRWVGGWEPRRDQHAAGLDRVQTSYGLVVELRRANRDALRAVLVPALRWRQEVGLRSEILSRQFRSNAAFHSIQHWVRGKLPRIANRYSSPATGERAAPRFEREPSSAATATACPLGLLLPRLPPSTLTTFAPARPPRARGRTSTISPKRSGDLRRAARDQPARQASDGFDARGRRFVPGWVLVAGGPLVGPGQLQS